MKLFSFKNNPFSVVEIFFKELISEFYMVILLNRHRKYEILPKKI